jgi:elongation factor G
MLRQWGTRARRASAHLSAPRRTNSLIADSPLLLHRLELRCSSSASSTAQNSIQEDAASVRNIRNIGILAHIDAGKTTTTERMLFYSGAIRRMGEVHDGDATMDFMPQERERGITIGAAAISFPWKEHHVNLIDTPGHVDFTIEVERAVRVLDGAVAVLDGVAGVEAQTETVWEQADRYKVPRIAFVNKLDREGASFVRSCESIEARFGVQTLCVQLPVGEEAEFHGLLDLVDMHLVKWVDKDGEQMQRLPLLPSAGGKMAELYERAIEARQTLIERAANFDDELGELFLMEEEIDNETLKAALRRITVQRGMASHAVVTLCGSALKNKGVQPLLDAVVDYLPSPLDLSPFEAHTVVNGKKTRGRGHGSENQVVQLTASSSEPLCALAFKVQHDRQRGLVVFFRVYSGLLNAKSQLVNASRGGTKERLTRLMHVSADDQEAVESISAGHIGAAVGLKHTYTGDTLVSAKDAANQLVLPGVQIPKPVFTCSVESESSAKQKDLDTALENLQREDPSFVVTVDDETGQTLMSGMGELHLDIIKERLRSDYKLEPSIGAMRVAYLESVTNSVEVPYTHDVMLGTDRHFAKVTVGVDPLLEHQEDRQEEDEDEEDEASSNVVHWKNQGAKKMPHAFALAIEEGLRAGLSRGVLTPNRVAYVKVSVDESDCEWDNDSSAASFRAAAALALKEALRQAEPAVLEPMMKLEVRAPDRCVGDVLADLSSQRRAHIQEVGAALGGESAASQGRSVVHANVPLAHMVGYATLLRSKTQGEASFGMQFLRYVEVDAATRDRLTGNLRRAPVKPFEASSAGD